MESQMLTIGKSLKRDPQVESLLRACRHELGLGHPGRQSEGIAHAGNMRSSGLDEATRKTQRELQRQRSRKISGAYPMYRWLGKEIDGYRESFGC